MNKLISTLIFLTCSIYINAQTVYSGMAAQYAAEGNFEKAIELELEGLKVLEKVHGTTNLGYATALTNLARYNYYLGNYEKAISLELEIDTILEYNHVTDENALITVSSDLGLFYYMLGDYNQAITYHRKAIEICGIDEEKFLSSYIKNMNGLIASYYSLRDYKTSLSLCENLILKFGNSGYVNEQEYINLLLNFANNHLALENYSEADVYFNIILEKFNNSSEYNSIQHVRILASLMNYYLIIGESNKAINLGRNGILILNDENGVFNNEKVVLLNNLANALMMVGDIREAIELEMQAKEILEKNSGITKPIYLNILITLSNCYGVLLDFNKELEYSLKACEITKDILGDQSEEYAMALLNIADFYYHSEDITKAIQIAEESLHIIAENKGFDNINFAKILFRLACFYGINNNFVKSTNAYEYASQIFYDLIGEFNEEYIISGLMLINNYFAIGDYKNLTIKVLNIYPLLKKNVLYNIKNIPTNKQQNFWKFKDKYFTEFIHQEIFSYPIPELIILGCNSIIFSKGLLLNSEMDFDKFLAETGDEELLEKYNEIKSLRLQLNKLYERPISERYVDTDSLERQANELERQLMQESAEFGDYTRNLEITWEDVRDNLKEKDAAIEFVSFPLNNDSTMYMAYVLRPNMETPELVKLFEEKDLTNLIDVDDKACIYTSRSASDLIWGKMMPQLDGVENIYFAPDGVLHQIAIEYFPDVDGEGMISERFNLHRVSSTREIALNRHNASTKEAVIYGGIKYDTDVTTMETESRKYDRTRTRGFSTYYNLGDSLALRGSLEYLDGSLTEAVNINGMMKENNYISTFLSGNDATEESFKNLSGKANSIIHISTHGFYWTESEAERKASLNDRLIFMSQLGDNARRNVEDKALTRTGLFMAGAKNALGGIELPEDVDDGILTAQEIANLDLRGLDLVVLSACQTGMGDISGDGVFGLQRGFKKAGANTILMSLWDVSDEATQILMTNFYKNYLGGMTKQLALLEAQKAVRGTPGYSDPEFWAAFILLDALN